jgi:hypothetical protein
MLPAQTGNTWIACWNGDSTLKGFKDLKGLVKIAPRFSGFTVANKFDDIIAVSEEATEKWANYFLTKAGRIVGKDSLHIFDNSADCESEGFIRFRDPKTEKVGLFDKNGNITVPAVYNELTRVNNGLLTALKDAEKIVEGEHYSWKGGKQMLLDTGNKLLIDSFNNNGNLNFFSVLVAAQPATDTIRQNFKGVNGQYYSFINFDKEFGQWLQSTLLRNISRQSLLEACFPKIKYWKEKKGWVSEPRAFFINRNVDLLRFLLLELNADSCDYTIFDESLNPFMYKGPAYSRYFDNCGEAKQSRYPVKNIVISYNRAKDIIQNHIEFLRTEQGYKLISISLGKGMLK